MLLKTIDRIQFDNCMINQVTYEKLFLDQKQLSTLISYHRTFISTKLSIIIDYEKRNFHKYAKKKRKGANELRNRNKQFILNCSIDNYKLMIMNNFSVVYGYIKSSLKLVTALAGLSIVMWTLKKEVDRLLKQ